jgi:transposase
VDADAHRVVDLLEDPSGEALVHWLDQHPGAGVICRDRDGVYASAARRGAPGALQVADRWHITHNLADALERFAVRALAQLRKALKAKEIPPPPGSPVCRSPGRLAARTEQRHAEVHELLAQGLPISAIGRRLRLNWRTVRRFASAQTADDVLDRAGRRASALDPFLPYLTRRWREGQHTAAVLYRELRQHGYRGSQPTVRRQLAAWRTTEPPTPAHAQLPGSRTLAWLLLRRPSDLDDKDRLLLDQLCERSPELTTARQLAQQFLRLVRERRGRQLPQWVAAVQRRGPPELRGFSRNLRRDWEAVYAGLTERWSSGSVEGNVNKLKVIKRQMFGRAGFDLLRTRVLLAN